MSLPQEKRDEAIALFDAADADTWTFTIERGNIEQGHTLSREAVEQTVELIDVFVMHRLLARWQRTSEPPTVARIEVRVLPQ